MRIKERYQLAADLRERYWAAGRRERGAMLDAFCLTTGYSRKYAISVLRGRQRKPRVLRKPRRRRYGKPFQVALSVYRQRWNWWWEVIECEQTFDARRTPRPTP
jgi:hypothetical protein